MADKTEPDPKPDGHGDDGGQGSADARLDRLEATQADQGSKLDRILDLLPGSGSHGSDEAGAAADGTTDAAPADIQSQVRAEIAATKAREAEEARRKGETDRLAAIEQAIEELKPEKTPREPQTGWRGKLQSAMFGKPE